jgi:hypothetical protein
MPAFESRLIEHINVRLVVDFAAPVLLDERGNNVDVRVAMHHAWPCRV